MANLKDLFTIAPLTDHMWERLDGTFAVHHIDDMVDPIAWLDQNGAGVRYVLTDGHYGLKSDWMERLPDLKLISTNGVGYDAVDTKLAVQREILVTHTPDVLSKEVATTAVMLLISCFRDFLSNAQIASSGRWEASGKLPLSRSADNRTIGILGLGRIGTEIANKLAPFDARIVYHSRNPRDLPYTYYADLSAMARDADALICVAPGGAGTRHLVGAKVIEALGPQGVLVNVGRGSVVDETALISALETGKLGAAGLDVFENEPHIPEALRSLPNVVLTPHIGSATIETRKAMADLAIDNLLQHIKDGNVLTAIPECAKLL